MLMDNILAESSAVLDAFLPGTSGGQGVIDALTGNYVIRPNGKSDNVNSLSFDWPQTAVNLLLFRINIKISQFTRLQEKFLKFKTHCSRKDMD